MASRLNPYLKFRDEAREAMDFYKGVFGGHLEIMTFGQAMPTGDAGQDNKIMHAQLEADNGILFMASDSPPGMDFQPGSKISMSLSGEDEAELRSYYEKLSAGGTIQLPLEKAPWGDTFGMLADKYGVEWMVNITARRA